MTRTTAAPRPCAAALLVAGTLAAALPPPAAAISEENEFVNDFGMVAIVAGQTARLSVLNATGDPDSRPCTVELRFFDGRGGMLGGPDTKVLGAREAAFLDLPYPRVGGAPPNARFGIHANVVAKFANPRERRACSNNLIPTLEVFDDATGATQFLHPGVIRGFNPQPDPPGTPGKN